MKTKNKFPLHHCRIENPCPVLIGACEGADSSAWTTPKWLQIPLVINIDQAVR